jgi:hypothetical protein
MRFDDVPGDSYPATQNGLANLIPLAAALLVVACLPLTDVPVVYADLLNTPGRCGAAGRERRQHLPAGLQEPVPRGGRLDLVAGVLSHRLGGQVPHPTTLARAGPPRGPEVAAQLNAALLDKLATDRLLRVASYPARREPRRHPRAPVRL